MANLHYIMQGFSKKINFCDEIIHLVKNRDYKEMYVLTAFVNEFAVKLLEEEIVNSNVKITFIAGVRNGVTTYQALERLLQMGIDVYSFDTARSEGIFHVKTIIAFNDYEAKVICGSANFTTGGLINNIEAGFISELNLREKGDKCIFDEVMDYINELIAFRYEYPQNIIYIDSCDKIDKLKEQGLLVDERKKTKKIFNSNNESDNETRTIVSKFPLERKKIKLPSQKNRQMEAIYRKVSNMTIEDVCVEVWKSKPLKKTHLGITNKKRTNVKGEMGLGKGKYKNQNIDQMTYFRYDVFEKLEWKKNQKGDEIAEGKFTLIISGINYGEYCLQILHKREGMVAYDQNNYVTSIRWGECSKIIKNESLLGKTLTLLKMQDSESFVLDIE
ncbi:MAG: phospholipase D family protein [Lachnospiraceae bacterium]|nr:phospholipase D family protein [Lachnospiraceae bacterium]